MNILGISAFYHDSAASLVINGEIMAAAQEERFTRKKHDANYPTQAIQFCLNQASLKLSDIDYVVFYDKPFLKFERLIETYMNFAPKGFLSFQKALPLWIKEKLFQKQLLKDYLQKEEPDFDWKNKLLFSEHHMSHASSAFYPSPFEEALVLTMDGVGEWTTTSVAIGKGNKLEIVKEIHFPHSIGLLYSAFTYYTGFKVNSGEYKVMGLAPYGEPLYTDLILEHLVDLKEDGSFCLDQKYFDYCTGLTMTNSHFHKLFGGAPRKESEPLTQKHMDLAASVQKAIETIILKLTKALHKEYNIDNLCLAGGVALNCVANGKILKQGHFKNIWIQPAAGDAGGALGAALCGSYQFNNEPRKLNSMDSMKGSLLGPSFSQTSIEESLSALGAKFEVLSEEELILKTSQALQESKTVGWFQGPMEFGPRALGNRSIIADPRSSNMQKTLNLKIKFRESFRPFAPSILRHHLNEWFDMNCDSPYMLLVTDVQKAKQKPTSLEEQKLFGIEKLNVRRSEIPAVTHVDYSARVQTVHQETNKKYFSLIDHFYKSTGCPVIINTSFNIRGEPIVCTPQDAFQCFMGTDLDVLSIGHCFLLKSEQDQRLLSDYKTKVELD